MAITNNRTRTTQAVKHWPVAVLDTPQVCAHFLDEGGIKEDAKNAPALVKEPWVRALGFSPTLCPSYTSQSTVVIQACTNIWKLDGTGASFPEGAREPL